MRFLGIAGAAALSLALAVVPLTYGQDQKPEEQPKPEAKPAQQAPKPIPPATQPPQEQRPEHNDHAMQQPDEKQQQSMEKDQKQEEKQAKQDQKQQEKNQKQETDQRQAQQEQKAAQDSRQKQAKQDQKQQEEMQKQQAKQDKQTREQHPASSTNEPAQRAQAANVQGGGGHIPDDKFREHFGREHHFHMSRPVIVEGAPRFQYSGFWFVLLDPWPAAWSYDDDVYIDYVDGGYYLCDPVHPGVQIAVSVVM